VSYPNLFARYSQALRDDAGEYGVLGGPATRRDSTSHFANRALEPHASCKKWTPRAAVGRHILYLVLELVEAGRLRRQATCGRTSEYGPNLPWRIRALHGWMA